MADYFLRSGAGGSATGADWPNAYTNMGALVAGSSPTGGDRIFIAHDHSYSGYSASQTWNFADGTAAPCKILVVDDSTASSSYTAANTPAASTLVNTVTALEAATAGAYTVNIQGNILVWGLEVQHGNNSSLCSSTQDNTQTWVHCKLRTNTGSPRQLNIGVDAAGASNIITWIDTEYQSCNNTGAGLKLIGNTQFVWLGGAYTIDTTQPTVPIQNTTRGITARFKLVDFSALTNVVYDGSNGPGGRVFFDRCKFSDIADISALSATEEGTEVVAVGCSTGTTPNPVHFFHGSNVATATHTTSVYRDSGAAGGGTNFSMVVQAKGSTPVCDFGRNLRVKLCDIVWDNTKTSIRVYAAQVNGQTRLTDIQGHIQVEFYQSAQAYGAMFTSRADDDDPLSAGTSWTTDSGSAWTGLTGEVMSYADVSPSSEASGPCSVYFVLTDNNNAANEEFYVCPKAELVA